MLFESFMLNLFVSLVLIVALTFDYVTKFFSYWYVRHVPSNTNIPFFGSDYYRVLGLRSSTQEVNTLYNQYPKDKFVGSVKSRIPHLVVKDPDAIKTLLSTDFEYFQRRGLGLDKSRDVCIRNNLYCAEGEKWTLLHEGLEALLNKLTEDFEDSLHESLSGTNGDTNVQQLLSNVLDAVFKDLLLGPNSNTNVITHMRSVAQKRTLLEKLKTYLKNVFPSLFILFGIVTIPGEPSSKTKKQLERSQLYETIKSANVFQLSVQEKRKSAASDVDFTYATLATFITEGYLPCLNLLAALLYDMATNPETQKNARSSEVYTCAAIKESLRLHPPHSVISRQCVKMYHYPDSNLVLDKNVTLNVPIEAMHHDEKYFKDAKMYKPERFLASEDSPSSHSFAYLPFGAGPRKCIGEQLSMSIVQKVTRAILKQYELDVCEKTPKAINMVDHHYGRVIQNDVWLRFKPVRS